MARPPGKQVLAEIRAYRRGLYAEMRGEPATAAANVKLRVLWDSVQAGTFDDEERARKRRTGEK